jgi:hypothetical protein
LSTGRRSIAVAGAVFAVLLAGLPLPASAGPVTLRLVPSGALSLAQGVAFQFRAVLRSSMPEPVRVNVVFRLTSIDGGGSVDFLSRTPNVPPSRTISFDEEVASAQWFRQVGTFEVSARVDDEPSPDRILFEVTAPTVATPRFQDVTAASGLDTELPGSGCGQYTAGAAWGDVEGDGDLDLYVPRKFESGQLWVNDGAGHFADEAAARGVDNSGHEGVAGVFADYDNDGDQDLYAVNDLAPNRLYRNDGTGHFTDVAPEAGVDTDEGDASAAWADYDDDGYLDLYVVSNSPCLPPDFYDADVLYHNEGDGTFTDQTSLLPEASTMGAGFQAAWWDYDGDGDQDLYLANDDWGPTPDLNHLWRNDGPDGEGGWRFTDVSVESGTGYKMNSMGIGIGDFDRDLDLDMAVSNIHATVLARNNGDGTFTDVAAAAGMGRPYQSAGVPSVTWGLIFADLNLDGWEDLFVAAGGTNDVPQQPEAVFANAGDGTFLDLSALSGADHKGSSRGVAVADYDRDGLLDLYVVDKAGSPRLYRNVTATTGYHWLEVDLTGTASNRDACGAQLVLAVAGGRLLREVFCGSISLSSGSDTTVHFGLGSDTAPTKLVVRWPSGARQVVNRPAVDQVLHLTEP